MLKPHKYTCMYACQHVQYEASRCQVPKQTARGYTCIYMYIYIYIYIYTYTHTAYIQASIDDMNRRVSECQNRRLEATHVYVYTRMCLGYTCTWIHTYPHTCIYLYTHMYVSRPASTIWMYIYIYIYIYIHTHMYVSRPASTIWIVAEYQNRRLEATHVYVYTRMCSGYTCTWIHTYPHTCIDSCMHVCRPVSTIWTVASPSTKIDG